VSAVRTISRASTSKGADPDAFLFARARIKADRNRRLSSDSDRDFDGIATLRRRVFSGQSRETKTGGSMQLANDHRRPVRAAPFTRAHSDVTSAPRQLRILVADDDRDSVLTLMMLLRDEGHEVRGVYNGQQALKAVLDFEPHAVLLDIALPDLSGWEVARRIRQRNTGKGPMLIGLSGEYKQGADRILSEIIGFDHYVLKPYDIQALLGLLAPLTLPDAEQ
jgi:two-component system OmpR family response regulator